MARRAFRPLFALRRAGVASAGPLRTWRYRDAPYVRTDPMPEAQPRPLEGYPVRLWAPTGEPRRFCLRSPYPENVLVVERYAGLGVFEGDDPRFEEVVRLPFGRAEQPRPPDAPAAGGGWSPTVTVHTTGWRQGTYRARIEAPEAPPEAVRQSAITFLVGPAAPGGRVAVLAPVSTWLAYNPWGGQSLYHNEFGPETTYLASAYRPNPALGWEAAGAIHAMRAEAPVHGWLDAEVGADLYPDWMLEHPHRLESYSALVLNYHCEYASDAMLDGLDQLVGGGRSLLALGANQLYWRIRWRLDRGGIECRKDGSAFSGGGGRGGLWRNLGRPEDETLGVRFTAPGTGTYAPYRVTDAGHWLYGGLGLTDGDIFGHRGSTPLPICGDETDKPTWASRRGTEVIARGLNRPDATDGVPTVWRPDDPAWDGSAGGTLALTPLSTSHAVLSTGAIHSASGLGSDRVFTTIVREFLRRYLRD